MNRSFDKIKTAMKIFGVFYFLFNLICLAVITILVFQTMNDIPEDFSPGWILTLFPLLGILAGYWLFRYRFGWFRSLVIIASLLITSAGVFISFVAAPAIEKAASHTPAKNKQPLDSKTQQFFEAVYKEDFARIKDLLDQGVDVNAKNHSKETALHLTNDKKVMVLLLERGADVHALNDLGMTPIFGRELDLVKILIKAGADINARSADGNTPFMWYCYGGYLEGMKYLVQQGADLDTCNRDGNNAGYIVDHFQPNTEAFYYVMSLNIAPCN